MEIEWIEDYIKAQHLALESIDRIRVKEVIDVLSQANATGKKIFVWKRRQRSQRVTLYD